MLVRLCDSQANRLDGLPVPHMLHHQQFWMVLFEEFLQNFIMVLAQGLLEDVPIELVLFNCLSEIGYQSLFMRLD